MKKQIVFFCSLIFLFYGCSTSHKIIKPVPSHAIDSVDFSSLEKPPKDWHERDEDFTRFRGISSELLYKNVLTKRKPKQQVIVAVVDGGVDITHEDLRDHIWTNKGEVPDNGKDDDDNGYIDDVHGWNFIGGPNGKDVNNDSFEVTRIYARLHPKYANTDTTTLNARQKQEYQLYKKVFSEYRYQINKLLKQYSNISSLQQSMNQADQILSQQIGKNYTYKDVQNLQPQDQQTAFAKNVMSYVMENDIDSTVIADQKKQVYDFAKYGYNPNFTSRNIVGDNYEDKTEQYYGNNDVAGPDPLHATHVAGIIGAVRNNKVGMNGIANDVLIMPVRVVPDGDERDKDVANGIRYAVDNGADIINMSFGKSYSPYKKVVDAAVKYADEHGVLMVHAAGNSSENSDKKGNFPTDTYGDYFNGTQSATNWISVGASSWKPNKNFVADFSNYGNQRVDLFAPGVDIYSSTPDNSYERLDGTSMASPVVSGAAALLMIYYPNLTAKQIRTVILHSVEKYANEMVNIPHKGSQKIRTAAFDTLSATGGELNIFKAFQAAQAMSK